MTDSEKLQHIKREVSAAVAHAKFIQTACAKVDVQLGYDIFKVIELLSRVLVVLEERLKVEK